jgi:phosphinothricin acetyltransferase
VVDHAVYEPRRPRPGLGRQLLTEPCADAERRGLYKLTSRVFTDNHASRAAHRAAGFEEVGIQRRHCPREGRWEDGVLVEWLLGPGAENV